MKYCMFFAALLLLAGCGTHRDYRHSKMLPSGQDICYLKHDNNISGGYVIPYASQSIEIVVGRR